MNALIDTLGFAERSESAGFGHEQARDLAEAFGQAHESGREGVVTKGFPDARRAEMEARLTRQIAEVGKDVSGRLWSTTAIIAGVSTAISATIAAVVALVLKAGGL